MKDTGFYINSDEVCTGYLNLYVPTQNITFICGDLEMMRLEANGNIFVKGKLIKNDIEAIDGFKEFLKFHKNK